METISLSAQTMFAELLQRTLDADFDAAFPENGTFRRKKQRNRFYWYFNWRDGAEVKSRYVGPVTDSAITERVKRFDSIKSDFKERREMVRALIAARLPAPDATTGAVVDAIAKAGFFRLRGVLVGTVAYQCYAGLLGVRLGGTAIMTQDADFAQFWGISQAIGETMAPILDVLQALDPTYRETPNLNDPFVTTRYVNDAKYKVEFLTPNRGSDAHLSKAAKMPALGGAGAQPLRHLDYLIHQPERSALLWQGGVAVTVPRAERFAVHKLIVSVERENAAKSQKNTMQAAALLKALAVRRPVELGEAWAEASAVGPRWREKLARGRARLDAEAEAALAGAIAKAETLGKRKPRP
jgi:hypothetical protein